MMNRFVFIVFFCAHFVIFSESKQCSLTLSDDTLIEWSGVNVNNIGSIQKTAVTGDVGGIKGIRVSGPTYSNTLVGRPTCDASKYFDLDSAEPELIQIKAKEELSNEWDNDRTTTDTNCEFIIVFDTTDCENTGSDNPGSLNIIFEITVEDVNLENPTFDQREGYTLNVIFPVPRNTPLNEVQLNVRDRDFTTEEIEFTIIGDQALNLLHITKDSPDRIGKNFPFSVLTNGPVSLLQDLKFQLQASDNFPGNPLTSTVDFTIVVSEESVPPTPEFDQSMYAGSVNISEIKAGFRLPIEIKLKDDFGASEDQIKLEVNDDKFSVERSGVEVFLAIAKEFTPESDSTRMHVILNATTNNGFADSDSTSVVIDISVVDDTSTTTTDGTTDETTTDGTTGSDSTTTEDDENTTTDITTEDTTTNTEPTTPPPGDDDDDDDDDDDGGNDGSEGDDDVGLLAATIVLAVLSGLLLVGFGFLFKDYTLTRKRKTKRPSGLARDNEKNSSGETEKTRKRSMTFSVSDEKSRRHRESAHTSPFPESDSLNDVDLKAEENVNNNNVEISKF